MEMLMLYLWFRSLHFSYNYVVEFPKCTIGKFILWIIVVYWVFAIGNPEKCEISLIVGVVIGIIGVLVGASGLIIACVTVKLR